MEGGGFNKMQRHEIDFHDPVIESSSNIESNIHVCVCVEKARTTTTTKTTTAAVVTAKGGAGDKNEATTTA